MLANDPGPGVSCSPVDDNMRILEAQIEGPESSPFAKGVFSLSIQIPDRYPIEPPRVRFLTPIYHPNIDGDGRICLDTLKMQPQGSWSPSVNINTLLLTIRLLMDCPNADDGLVPEITDEYKRDIHQWKRKAAEHTKLNAIPKLVPEIEVPTGEKGDISVPVHHPVPIADAAESEGSSDEGSEGEFTEDGSEDEATIPESPSFGKRRKLK